jgi:hypothetical protein
MEWTHSESETDVSELYFEKTSTAILFVLLVLYYLTYFVLLPS